MNSATKLKLWKRRRIIFYRFGFSNLPEKVEYFQNRKNSLIVAIVIFLLSLSVFFFLEKEFATKVVAFVLLFSLFKVFRAFKEPVLKLDNVGIHFQSVRFDWNKIKRVKVNWKQYTLVFEIELINGKILTEKVENLQLKDLYEARRNVRAFKKRYRIPYRFQQTRKNGLVQKIL